MPAGSRAAQTTQGRSRSSCGRGLGLDQRDEHILKAGVVLAILLAQLGERAFGDQTPRCDDADPAIRSATSRICVVIITVQPRRTRSCNSPLTWRADSAS